MRKVAFLGALTIWIFGTSGFAVRPQMVGYLLLILELLILQLGQTRTPRWFLALPALFALWANCHSSFLLGLMLAALYLFSSYWSFQSGLLVARRWQPRDQRMLAAGLALSLMAVCLNPSGMKLVGYPLDTMFHQPIVLSVVSEWQPLQLTSPRGVALLATLGAILILVITRRQELFWHEALIVGLATWLAGSHRRLVFPAGILLAPVLTRLLADCWERYRAERDHPVANAVLIASSLAIMFFAFPSRTEPGCTGGKGQPGKGGAIHPGASPTGTDAERLGRWRLPDLGRAGISGFHRWARRCLRVDWRHPRVWQMGDSRGAAPVALLDKYHINFCLLERGSPVANVLPLLPRLEGCLH